MENEAPKRDLTLDELIDIGPIKGLECLYDSLNMLKELSIRIKESANAMPYN